MNLGSRIKALEETRRLAGELFTDGNVSTVVSYKIYVVGPCQPADLYYLLNMDQRTCSCNGSRSLDCEHRLAVQMVIEEEE